VVMDKFLDLVVEKLGPLGHSRLGTKIHQEPNPSLEATDLVFGPALLPTQILNAKFENQFFVVVSNETFFAVSSVARFHVRKDVLTEILWSTS